MAIRTNSIKEKTMQEFLNSFLFSIITAVAGYALAHIFPMSSVIDLFKKK